MEPKKSSENSPDQAQKTDFSPSDSDQERQSSPKPLSKEAASKQPFNYLKGWRLFWSSVAIYAGLFFVNFEVSIVSTSVVGISSDLNDFRRSNWIVTAYLVAYTGCFIIWAKLSDIYGRKQILCFAILLFTAFSGACGAAQTMTELIIVRAMQGIGGSGTYAISVVMFFELVPPEKLPTYFAMVSSVFALSYGLGPLLGGAIVSNTTWRWIFLLNVPAGVIILCLFLIALPNDFPYQGGHPAAPSKDRRLMSLSTIRRLDMLGFVLLLAACVLLICGLEEAGFDYEWSSGFVISMLVVAGVCAICFLVWEYRATVHGKIIEPVFPWRFLQNRVFVGLLLNCIFAGAPYTIAIVQIPQRFQAVNSQSPLEAGIRLLPLVFLSPAGSYVASWLAKTKIPPVALLLVAAGLQAIGSGLLSSLPLSSEILPAQYGYEIIFGFGLGISIATLLLLIGPNTEPRDRAVAMGAVYQFRALGGGCGLAIVTAVMNSSLNSSLGSTLQQEQLNGVLRNVGEIDNLPSEMQTTVRGAFGEQYNLQMKIVLGFTLAQFLGTLLCIQKKKK